MTRLGVSNTRPVGRFLWLGHNYIGRFLWLCHNYMGHNYLSHNYIIHNYIRPVGRFLWLGRVRPRSAHNRNQCWADVGGGLIDADWLNSSLVVLADIVMADRVMAWRYAGKW